MAATTKFVTEYFLSQNFTPQSGVTPGNDNLLWLNCDQVKARYQVDISGVSSTGERFPLENQIFSNQAFATANLSYVFNNSPEVGVSVYTGTLFVDKYDENAEFTGEVGLQLSFTSGSVPSGQSDYRSVRVKIYDEDITTLLYDYTVDGVGTFPAFSHYYNEGTDVGFFVEIICTNDNWAYPRPASTFKLEVTSGNFITSDGSYFSESIQGITTMYLTCPGLITSTNNNTFSSNSNGAITYHPNESGEMIYALLTRQSGHTYNSANGYKIPQITESFGGNLSANAKFVVTSLNSVQNEMLGSIVSVGSRTISKDFLSNTSLYYRYSLINNTGYAQQFMYGLSPLKYCDFTPIYYNQTINSTSVTNAHTVMLKQLTIVGYNQGMGNTVELPLWFVSPANSNLEITDTFRVKLVIHCPNGGQVRLTCNDGNEGLINAVFIDGEYHTFIAYHFISAGGYSNPNSVTSISCPINLSFYLRARFIYATGAWIEIVPVSNCSTSTVFPYRFDQYGLIYN